MGLPGLPTNTLAFPPITPSAQVGWPGVNHVQGKPGDKKDYSAVIQKAQVRVALKTELAGWVLVGVSSASRERGEIRGPWRVLTAAFSFRPSAQQEMPGFEWEPEEDAAKFVTTGFARNAVLGVAGDVVKAVQEGKLKHIFLVGGCDGGGACRAPLLVWPGLGPGWLQGSDSVPSPSSHHLTHIISLA